MAAQYVGVLFLYMDTRVECVSEILEEVEGCLRRRMREVIGVPIVMAPTSTITRLECGLPVEKAWGAPRGFDAAAAEAVQWDKWEPVEKKVGSDGRH